MRSESAQLKPKHPPKGSLLLWSSLCLFLICYIGSALRSAARTPAWMDEVLTLWTIRLPSASQIYSALLRGAQYDPPPFHLALHYYAKFVGGSYLALRLPSILAVLLAGLCAFVVFRRHLGNAPAAFGCCLLLETLRPYALLIRPYAPAACCFAVALLLWDDLNRRYNWWRCTLIGLLLAFAVSLHFYSVLFVPCFGLMELTRTVRTRNFRLSLWFALVAAGASIFLYLPSMHALSQYNAGDASSPAFYAKPTLSKLILAYSDISFMGGSIIILVFAAMAAIAIGRFCGFRGADEHKDDHAGQKDFWTLAFGAVLLPLIVFLFSLAVTRTFNERYTIAGAVGMSALLTGIFSDALFFRRAVPLILLLASLLTLHHRIYSIGEFDQSALFRATPGPYPIVVAEGTQFLALEESAPADIRSRLIYLTPPPTVQVPDVTNQHQIERWKALNPNLPVDDTSEFLRLHPKFYLVDTRSSDDTPATYLLSKRLVELTAQPGNVLLYKSRSPSDPDGW